MGKVNHIKGTAAESSATSVFDEHYYQRFYSDPKTRVATPRYYRKLAAFIHAYSEMLDVAVDRIVDLGCGTGALRGPLSKLFSGASYLGVELSEHACERYGWTRGCASSFRSSKRFDLVICHDVLQYLDDLPAAEAIDSFAKLTRGVVYFSVLTKEDWQHCVDQQRTDSNVFLRPASWYRSRLKQHFINAGGGIYLPKKTDAIVYALESLD